MKDYEVTVNFGGMIGVDNTYSVTAENEEKAKAEALEMAKDDLCIEESEGVDMDEFTVTISFCGFIGCEQQYEVWSGDLDEAYDEALEMAYDDLYVEDVEEV